MRAKSPAYRGSPVRPFPLLITSLFAAFCLGACLQGESAIDPGSTDPGGTDPDDAGPMSAEGASHDYSYAVKDNLLFITRDQVWRRCLGDSLAADTAKARTDTIEFELEENAWRHFRGRETLNSGAVVRWVRTFKRMGDGSGLKGVWFRPEDSYRVVSGNLDASEKTQQDAAMRNANITLKYHEDRVIVTDEVYTDYSDIRLADQFIDFWNGTLYPDLAPDRSVYDIELREADRYTVELKGMKDGETVRLSRYPNGNMTITSSNSGHAALHYFGEPKSCPNPQEPVWYRGFLDANRKGR